MSAGFITHAATLSIGSIKVRPTRGSTVKTVNAVTPNSGKVE